MQKIYAVFRNTIKSNSKTKFFLMALLSLLIALTIYLPFSQSKWGLKAYYYTNAEWKGTPALQKIEKNPFLLGEVTENILSAAVFSAKWKGYINIQESGVYQFATNSDDGSSLSIDKNVIVDNGGAHGLQRVSNTITLKKGVYPIEILYFQVGGYNILEVLWRQPGKTESFIPHELLFSHRPSWLSLHSRKITLVLPQILKISWLLVIVGILGQVILRKVIQKKVLISIVQSFGLSIVSLILFFGIGEFIARYKYTPRSIDYAWIFEYDKDKVFRLKSSHTGEYGGIEISTNSFGYRDEEIPITKSMNTIRIVGLGDSITFGHGNVLQQELYLEVLEQLLNEYSSSMTTEVINTACPGNSARQEYYDLKRTLPFQPDIVIIQYTLNDVFEPYLVLKEHGGEGKDYHGVEDMPYYDYYLSQHSALYLFLKDILHRVTFRSMTKEELRKKVLEREVFQLQDSLVTYHDHPQIQNAWKQYLSWLEQIVNLCHKHNLSCLLLISPYSFQFELTDSLAYPQQILKQFASKHHVMTIDLLASLQQKFKEQMIQKYSLSSAISYEELLIYLQEHRNEDIDTFWYSYFLDADHYTIKGHKYVAQILYETLLTHQIYSN